MSPSEPLVLGFDTSLAHCGAALMCGDRCLAAEYENMSRGQSERLFPMLAEVLANGGAGWDDLDAIGVGTGPGNFTGIRISISAARGLALALDIPAIGVSLLDALSYGTDAPVLACLDARRGEGYFQRFGFGEPGPFLAPASAVQDSTPGLTCIGTIGAEMAERLNARHAPAAYAPASAIARIAQRRMDQPVSAPAPLYVRSPDAAPARDLPPVMLD